MAYRSARSRRITTRWRSRRSPASTWHWSSCVTSISTADTDAKQIASAYVQAVEDLQKRHPQTAFVAVTTPLTTIQTGPKAWVKRALGKTPAGYVENARRDEFNAVLRQKFAANRLFDVARLEAQGGAQPVLFDYEGRTLEALDPALTSDGGHLNDAGKRVVGSAFVKFLANLDAS